MNKDEMRARAAELAMQYLALLPEDVRSGFVGLKTEEGKKTVAIDGITELADAFIEYIKGKPGTARRIQIELT